MMVERMQEKVFVRGQEHKKKSVLLDLALWAGNSLISEALIGMEISGDMSSREQQSHKKTRHTPQVQKPHTT